MAENEENTLNVNYKMVLQYDGSRYDGWQKQMTTDKTIQGKMEAVLSRMTGETIEVHGSGRTDKGVHAAGQVVNFYLPEPMEPQQIKAYCNEYLPEDIGVLSVEQVPCRFHSRLNAVRKTYAYRIEMSEKKDVFTRKYTYGLGKALDIEKMKAASEFLLGTHDFKSFCGNKKMKKSTVRTIEKIEFEEKGTTLTIRYTGNGFLQYMVRILTGTLIETGLGEREPESIPAVLEALSREAAGPAAPPEGLCLEQVEYGSGKNA